MSRLFCFIFVAFHVCAWMVFMVDAQDLDKVCQELLQNLDMNPQAVDLDTLQKCIDRWDKRLRGTPNDDTIRIQHNRMQTFLRNANGPSPQRVPPARPPSPGRPRSEEVALKKPTRTQATIREVLHIIQQNLLKKKRPFTFGQNCIDLVNTLLVTPNPPIPTGLHQAREHQTTVQDCVKVWEMLRDKAKDDNEKQALQHELELLQGRFDQVEKELKRRKSQRNAKAQKDERILIHHCALLVDTLPSNPRNLATMKKMLQYKAELDQCIVLWARLMKRNRTRVGVDDGLEQLKTELARVEDLIRNQVQRQEQQNVGAAASQVEASNRKRPSGGLGKQPKSPLQVALSKSKIPKLVILDSDDSQESTDDPKDCIQLAEALRLKPKEPIPRSFALTAMIKRLNKCITLLDNLWSQENNQAKRGTYMTAIDRMNVRLKLIEDTQRQRKSDYSKDNYRKRVEMLKQSSQVDSMTGGDQSGKPMSPVQVAPQSPRQIVPPSPNSPRRIAPPSPNSPRQVAPPNPNSPRRVAPPNPNSPPRRVAQPKPKSPPQVPQDPEVLKARCRELHLKGHLTRFPPAPVGVTQVDHFTYFSALLESCLRMWEDRITKEGSESLIPQRGLFKRAHERAQGLLKRAISNARNPKVAFLKHTFQSPPRESPKRKSPPKAPSPIRNSPPKASPKRKSPPKAPSPIRNSPPKASPKRKSPPKAPSPIRNSPPMGSQSEFESEWNFNQFNGPQANQFQVPQVPPLPEECERLLNGDQLENPQPALANLLRRCWRLCEQRVRDADKISWSIFAESNKKSYEQVLAKQRDRFKEAFEKLNKLLKP